MLMQEFTKYHGLGNDFIIIDNRDNKIQTNSDKDEFAKYIQYLCHRNTGIGGDGVMFVENDIPEQSDNVKVDIRYRIFNSDGYESRICGNGLRCFTKYLIDNGIVNSNNVMHIRTNIGVLACSQFNNNLYKTQIGKASSKLSDIPAISFNNDNANNAQDSVINQCLKIDENRSVNVTLIGTGNPHCVIYVDDVEKADVEGIDILPESANVEFVQIIDYNTIKIRVYERACGETLACGTGSCAAVVAGILNNKNSHSVQVQLRGGILQIDVNPNDLDLTIVGPAKFVFKGSVQVDL